MMSIRTGVRALVMVTLCYGALEIVGLLLLLLLLGIYSLKCSWSRRLRSVLLYAPEYQLHVRPIRCGTIITTAI